MRKFGLIYYSREELRLPIIKKGLFIMNPILIIILVSTIIFISAFAVTYQPGLKPGMEVKYEFLHYPDIKDAIVTVVDVEGNLVKLNTISNYYNGNVNEEIITINIGSSEKTIILPTNQDERWTSTHGTNTISVIDDHLEINMIPKDGYAEMEYSFQEPLDIWDVSYFYYFISINGLSEGERYTIWMTDTTGKSKFFPIDFDVNEPRKSKFIIWDKKELFNFNTIPQDELDRGKISKISIIYDGESDRTILLRNFETDQPIDHGSGFFKYFVVTSELAKGDPIYPNIQAVINEELPNDDQPDPIILQHTYRKFVVAFDDCDGGGCSSAYTYDKESGFLTKFWTSKSGTQIQLVDQKGVWAPPNTAMLALAIMHEGWINSILPNIWYIIGLISIYIIGFVGSIIYDKWKRGTLSLGMMKQWWPFLVILLIIFILGEVVRRIGI